MTRAIKSLAKSCHITTFVSEMKGSCPSASWKLFSWIDFLTCILTLLKGKMSFSIWFGIMLWRFFIVAFQLKKESPYLHCVTNVSKIILSNFSTAFNSGWATSPTCSICLICFFLGIRQKLFALRAESSHLYLSFAFLIRPFSSFKVSFQTLSASALFSSFPTLQQ